MVKAIETSRLIYVPVSGGMREATEEELSYHGWDRQPFYYHEIEFQAIQAQRDALKAECKQLRNLMTEAYGFWCHYSCLSEMAQDDMSNERHEMLERMKASGESS